MIIKRATYMVDICTEILEILSSTRKNNCIPGGWWTLRLTIEKLWRIVTGLSNHRRLSVLHFSNTRVELLWINRLWYSMVKVCRWCPKWDTDRISDVSSRPTVVQPRHLEISPLIKRWSTYWSKRSDFIHLQAETRARLLCKQERC